MKIKKNINYKSGTRSNKKNGIFSLFILMVLSSYNGCAQEVKKLFHEEYSKWALVIQPAKITGFDTGNIDQTVYPRLRFKDSDSFQLGFYFNFAQIRNFNFKTGLLLKQFAPSLSLNVADQDFESYTGSGLLTIKPVDEFFFSIPVKTEYYLRLAPKMNLVVGAGMNLNLMAKSGTVSSGISIYESGNQSSILITEAVRKQISMAGEFSVGVNRKTSFALFQLDVFYNINMMEYMAKGQYQIRNFSDNKIREGYFNVSGDSYGLILSISPQKGGLKKKIKE